MAARWGPLAKLVKHFGEEMCAAVEHMEAQGLTPTLGSFKEAEGITPTFAKKIIDYLNGKPTIAGLKKTCSEVKKQMMWTFQIMHPKADPALIHPSRRMPCH